ncbi:MAG: sel1 repeat family protein [Fibrobacter sp.]|nr:sel1 repeat family protein [Fibrobacter sp.]
MENEFFKAIGLYIDSQYIKVYTKYWVYERGRCSTVPAFVLRRDCSDEDLLKHIKICFENSKYISEKEYDNLGGWDVLWDILKKALKKKSLKNFYQTSVGFCLVWEQEQTEFLKKEGETEVHVEVWKYYVGKAASQRPADEKFDLKYDEASLGEFVVKLRQIMEEMYEKYHVKSNNEIPKAIKKPGKREIRSLVKKNIIGDFMEKEFFRQIYLYVDSQYIRVTTQYWVYECGTCESVPAFLLPRDCSDEELLEHIKICFENSKYISEEEYDKLGGWDAVKKVLKIKSEKNFCQTSVGFSLEWTGEMAVHISVWKYYVGKAASQTTADETFDLEYDEASPAKFVVRLRQIMEEMYEKYHVKSNDEIRQAKKKPGKREINKALSDLEKKDTLCRRIVSKKYGWKQSSFINWKVEDGYYFYLVHLNCYGEATLYVKPLYIDDLWWDVFEMSSNKKAPMSLRGNGTFSLDGVKILKTPDLFDIRTNERGAEYELEKIQKYSNEDIEKIWDNVFRQFDDEVKRFLKENPDPDSYFPEEEKCHEYYMLITYLHAGDRQKVLDKIAEFRAIPNRIKSRLGASYNGKTRDGLDFIEAWCLRELAEQGDVMAQYKLGTAYEDGSCVPIDNEKAVFWYRKAAEQGNSSAQYSLGRMFDYGCGIPEDKQEAAIWYRKAAEQGDGDAQNDLGVMYLTGEGVPEDKTQAAFWFRKAAEQGIATAQNNLGVRYLNGDGIPEDKAQAAFWFRKAAEQGLAAAQFNLGVRCFKGEGVPKDKSEAVSWFQKAAEQGLEEAQINLDLILQDKQETQA